MNASGWQGVLRGALHPGQGAARALYRVVRWLPLPAQDKWTGALQLLRLQVLVLGQQRRGGDGAQGPGPLAGETLHQTGRKWLERRLLSVPGSMSKAELVGDTYATAATTLNLPSQVRVAAERVRVTTYFCPFLDDARRRGGDPAAVCQWVCGERRSLFKGMSEGFPFSLVYRAPQMMGQGAEACVKELEVRAAPPHPRRRRRPWARRRAGAGDGGEAPASILKVDF
jgi:hypothetical protein